MEDNFKNTLKRLIKEEYNDNQIDTYYDEILELLKKRSIELDDESSFKLHEKLKEFFNRLV